MTKPYKRNMTQSLPKHAETLRRTHKMDAKSCQDHAIIITDPNHQIMLLLVITYLTSFDNVHLLEKSPDHRPLACQIRFSTFLVPWFLVSFNPQPCARGRPWGHPTPKLVSTWQKVDKGRSDFSSPCFPKVWCFSIFGRPKTSSRKQRFFDAGQNP